MQEFLLVIVVIALIGLYGIVMYRFSKKRIIKQPEVSPLEDLMREHGVVHRLMLIYQEFVRRLENNENIDWIVLGKTTDIIQQFIEEYHEINEETYIFPRFEHDKLLGDLVKTLADQHQVGKSITIKIKKYAQDRRITSDADRNELILLMNEYILMYSAHSAHEDTELYQAFRASFTASEYEKLAHIFEKQEIAKFGEDGFNKMIHLVADLEKSLGIENLAHYTPR